MNDSTNIKISKRLGGISDISFGVHLQPSLSGAIPYLQIRQFNEFGMLQEKAAEFIDSNKKSKQYQLRDGDVLFVGKGSRLFAWCYREIYGPYVASSIFFVLRPDQKIIYPEYLAAILNTPQTKAKFQQLGSGTNIFSIRKSELAATEIKIPPMDEQRRIFALSDLHQKGIAITRELLMQKENLYTAIISKLIR